MPVCGWHGKELIGGVCLQCIEEEQKRHNRAVEKELQQQRRDAEELQQQRRDAERNAEFERDIDWSLQPTADFLREVEKVNEERRQQQRVQSNSTDQVTRGPKVKRQRFPKSLPYWILGIFGPWIWSTVAVFVYEIVFSKMVPYQMAKPYLVNSVIAAWILAPIILWAVRKK